MTSKRYSSYRSRPFESNASIFPLWRGQQTVGSLVVFEDGLPKKSDYRKFIIKGDRKDDLSSVYEVVSRRFKEQSHPQDSRFAYEPVTAGN